MKSIGFNSTCLLSPKSSKDREDLNSWWTRTGSSTPERSLKIQPSTLLGDAGNESLLPSVPVMPTSPWVLEKLLLRKGLKGKLSPFQ